MQVNPVVVTAEQVKASTLAAGLTKIDHHDCAICGVMVKYIVHNDDLYFDSSCGCVSSEPRHVGWEDAAKWVNMQTKEEARVSIAALFHLDVKASPPSERPVRKLQSYTVEVTVTRVIMVHSTAENAEQAEKDAFNHFRDEGYEVIRAKATPKT